MQNSVKIDYFAVTVKETPPEKVLEDILLMSLENFALLPWGIININFITPVLILRFILTKR